MLELRIHSKLFWQTGGTNMRTPSIRRWEDSTELDVKRELFHLSNTLSPWSVRMSSLCFGGGTDNGKWRRETRVNKKESMFAPAEVEPPMSFGESSHFCALPRNAGAAAWAGGRLSADVQ